MSAFEKYKLTFWDKVLMEGGGWGSLIMFFMGIWWNDFRWRLYFTSIFLFVIIVLHYAVLNDRDKELLKIGEKGK